MQYPKNSFTFNSFYDRTNTVHITGSSFRRESYIYLKSKEKMVMDYKVFRAINQLSGRYSSLDMLMILISKKVRYIFMFVLIFMWFRNDSQKKLTLNAVISAVFTLFIHTLMKCFYFKPRPFIKHRVGILIPSKMDSSFLSKHTLLTFAVSTSIFLHKRIV